MQDFFTNEIITLKKNLQTYFNEQFKDLNLKSSEIKLIYILFKIKEDSQAELAKKLDCDKSHIHRIVIKLIMKKIIGFNSHNLKSRNLKIKLTEYGEKIAVEINKKLEYCQSIIIKGISLDDMAATKRVIKQLNENIKKEKIDV